MDGPAENTSYRRTNPSLRYFQSVEGSWSGPFDLAVTSWRELCLTPVSWANKLRFLSFALLRVFLGPPVLETEVRIEELDFVAHFSRVSKWGMTLYRAEENFYLHSNGLDFRIEGREWLFPLLNRPCQLAPASARIDDSGKRATYQWRWFEEDWIMSNLLVDGNVESEITCSWARAKQTLKRV